MSTQELTAQFARINETVAAYHVTLDQGAPQASADFTQAAQDLRAQLLTLFYEAEEETFEDGMASAFSRRLLALLAEQGEPVMNQIILLTEENAIAPEVLAEALRWFGHMGEGVAYAHRRWLLEHALHHASVRVRDGAILGLSFLEDPGTISALKRALAQEPHATLRHDIAQVLQDLQESLP